MARKVGQIVRRGDRTWLVRVYNGRDPGSKRRKYLNKTVRGGVRDAQSHLNKMLGERDHGRNLDSSRRTLSQYLDRWLDVCTKSRLRAKSLLDYEGLLRPLCPSPARREALAIVAVFDIQMLYHDLLDGGMSARSIRYTHRSLAVGARPRSSLEPYSGESAESCRPAKTKRSAGSSTLG